MSTNLVKQTGEKGNAAENVRNGRMKKLCVYAMMLMLLICETGCGRKENQTKSTTEILNTESVESVSTVERMEYTETIEDSTEEEYIENNQSISDVETTESEMESVSTNKINIQIRDTILTATLESNTTTDALRKMLAREPLTIEFSRYGGFEQVGQIGVDLPREDVQMTTQAGDIVLYTGNQMVMFYGSNSWSYTKLGRIDNLTENQLADILGKDSVTVTFTLTEEI